MAGRNVWYSNDEDIPRDLDLVFQQIGEVQWAALSREQFVHSLTQYFPKIWQVSGPVCTANRFSLTICVITHIMCMEGGGELDDLFCGIL